MSSQTKTDNHHLGAKLALRRKFLETFHADKPFSVVDCFSGEAEAIWTRLRAEFPVREYLALDVKKKRGRLKMDSLRYLQNQEWRHDVVDLDAYGAPWRHWYEVLKRGRSVTVFLTIGNTMFKKQQSEAQAAAGLTFKTLSGRVAFKIPAGLHGSVTEIVEKYNLALACDRYSIPLAMEAENNGGTARYIGVRLEKLPAKSPAKGEDTAQA
jgi:hypothetical protein